MDSQDWKDTHDGPGWYHLALLKCGHCSYVSGVGRVYRCTDDIFNLSVYCDMEFYKTYVLTCGGQLDQEYDDVKYLAINIPTLPNRRAVLERDRLRERLDSFRHGNLTMDELMEYLKGIKFFGRPSCGCVTAKDLTEYAIEATALYFSRRFGVPEFSHCIKVNNTDCTDKSH